MLSSSNVAHPQYKMLPKEGEQEDRGVVVAVLLPESYKTPGKFSHG